MLWRYAVEESFAGVESDRCDVGAKLVDVAGGEVLVDRRCPSGDSDVAITRGVLRLLEGGIDAVGDECEGRASLHRQRLARMVREHEHRSVVGRVLAPPAGPGQIPSAVALSSRPRRNRDLAPQYTLRRLRRAAGVRHRSHPVQPNDLGHGPLGCRVRKGAGSARAGTPSSVTAPDHVRLSVEAGRSWLVDAAQGWHFGTAPVRPSYS